MFVIRAFDQQATNLQRQGQLALWPPSFGQEAAQVGSARAARPQDHLFPSYREHVVCTIRGVDPVDIIRRHARPHPRRVEPVRPEERQHAHLHARARVADAARDRPRDGARLRRQVRVRRPRARRGRHRLLRRRRVQPGRRARGDGLRRELPHARGLLPAEQPVGDLGARRDPVALAAVSPRRGVRHPEHSDRRQRRARQLRRHPRRARRGALGRRPARDRGDDVPDGRAHHERRPDEVPHLRRGGVVGAPRPDRADAARTCAVGVRRTRSSPTSRPRRAAVADDARVRTVELGGDPHRPDVRPRLQRAAPADRSSSARGSPSTRHPSRRGLRERPRSTAATVRATNDAVQPRAQRGAAARDEPRTTACSSWARTSASSAGCSA